MCIFNVCLFLFLAVLVKLNHAVLNGHNAVVRLFCEKSCRFCKEKFFKMFVLKCRVLNTLVQVGFKYFFCKFRST